jgi:hypothetical protein
MICSAPLHEKLKLFIVIILIDGFKAKKFDQIDLYKKKIEP